MQASVSVFVKAGESAECIVSCCERMHMPADSVHDLFSLQPATLTAAKRAAHCA
jgi:hypothetical protein